MTLSSLLCKFNVIRKKIYYSSCKCSITCVVSKRSFICEHVGKIKGWTDSVMSNTWVIWQQALYMPDFSKPGEKNTTTMLQIHSILSYHFLWAFLSSRVCHKGFSEAASCCAVSGHLLAVVCYLLGWLIIRMNHHGSNWQQVKAGSLKGEADVFLRSLDFT